MDTRERGFMATQHEEYGDVSERDIVQTYIDEELDVNIDMFSDYNEYLAENNYETWFMFDELNDRLCGLTPTEIIRMSYFGSFSFNDEYVSYDGYENLKSCSEYEMVQAMKNDADFLHWYVEKNDLLDDDEISESLAWCRRYLALGY